MIGLLVLIGGVLTILYVTFRNTEITPEVTDLSGNTITPESNYSGESDAMPSQETFDDRVLAFGRAISIAEGFGKAGAIPTVYHNPGDLKPPDGSNNFWIGQTGVGKGGHAIFSSDAAGYSALYRQIRLWQSGKSRVIFPYFTFTQAAQKYAENWQPWLAHVTRELGVQPTDTLGDYFDGQT